MDSDSKRELVEHSGIRLMPLQFLETEAVGAKRENIRQEKASVKQSAVTEPCEAKREYSEESERIERTERLSKIRSEASAAFKIGRLPEWARRSVLNTEENRYVRTILKEQRLNTICESGRCPNKGECWAAGTATFMLMGDVCTRTCQFCAVNKGLPAVLDPEEPQRVVKASISMGLKHVVLTSVNRDELPDQGAGHFAQTISALKEAIPGIAVEILTPDFQGREDCLATVLAAQPAVFNHNLETVPRLYRRVRPGSKYKRSLDVLAAAKRLAPSIPIKSGLMLGLGEKKEEVEEVLYDLRVHHCDILTLGQYLRPSLKQLPVDRYINPEEFEEFANFAQSIGFSKVHSGPLVRSSYHAAELAQTVGTG